MTRQQLDKRLRTVDAHVNPPLDPQFTRFAEDVIRFGGNEPTPEAVDQLARWYAGGYRKHPLSRSD